MAIARSLACGYARRPRRAADAQARDPEGLPRGADAPAVRGGRPPGAARHHPRLPRAPSTTIGSNASRSCGPGDPALRAGRPVRPGHHRTGLDRGDRGRRRGADDAVVRALRHGPRDAGRPRRPERAPGEQREGDPAGHADLHGVPEAHRALLRGPRHRGQGRLVLRRHGGEGPRDRRRDRRHHRDGQHPARARDEDHRDAPVVGARVDREPRGARRSVRSAAMDDVRTLLLGALRAEGAC